MKTERILMSLMFVVCAAAVLLAVVAMTHSGIEPVPHMAHAAAHAAVATTPSA